MKKILIRFLKACLAMLGEDSQPMISKADIERVYRNRTYTATEINMVDGW